MAPFTVLSDGNVRNLLNTLNRADIQHLRNVLYEALHTYSTGSEDECACAANQPSRIILTSKGGPGSNATLVMPAKSADYRGIKIVSLAESNTPSSKSSKSSFAEAPSPISLSSRSSTTSSMPSVTSLPSSTSTLSGLTTLTSQTSISSTLSTNPKGTLTLLSSNGDPLGLINAEEITAFRTALAATLLITKREHVKTVVVFGAGRQAYWHLRLALLLRGEHIKHIYIINRSFERANELMSQVSPPQSESSEEGFNGLGDEWRWHNASVGVLTPSYGEYPRLLKKRVRAADVIFCCTPSTTPLFPAEHVTSHEGSLKGRYITAIGSYKPHMIELHPDILRHAAAPHGHPGRHFHKHAARAAIIVDSLESCLREAGEVIQAGLNSHQLVELGELIMLKKQAEMDRLMAHGDDKAGATPDDVKSRERWLADGNVIYKSVGLGLMDIVIGGALLKLADERRIGTVVEDF